MFVCLARRPIAEAFFSWAVQPLAAAALLHPLPRLARSRQPVAVWGRWVGVWRGVRSLPGPERTLFASSLQRSRSPSQFSHFFCLAPSLPQNQNTHQGKGRRRQGQLSVDPDGAGLGQWERRRRGVSGGRRGRGAFSSSFFCARLVCGESASSFTPLLCCQYLCLSHLAGPAGGRDAGDQGLGGQEHGGGLVGGETGSCAER